MGNLVCSALPGVWMAVRGGGQEWVISYSNNTIIVMVITQTDREINRLCACWLNESATSEQRFKFKAKHNQRCRSEESNEQLYENKLHKPHNVINYQHVSGGKSDKGILKAEVHIQTSCSIIRNDTENDYCKQSQIIPQKRECLLNFLSRELPSCLMTSHAVILWNLWHTLSQENLCYCIPEKCTQNPFISQSFSGGEVWRWKLWVAN